MNSYHIKIYGGCQVDERHIDADGIDWIGQATSIRFYKKTGDKKEPKETVAIYPTGITVILSIEPKR